MLPLLPQRLAKVLEITLRYHRLILPTKDPDLKVFDIGLALSRLHTRGLQVLEVLIDNFVGVNVPGDFIARLFIRNEFFDIRSQYISSKAYIGSFLRRYSYQQGRRGLCRTLKY